MKTKTFTTATLIQWYKEKIRRYQSIVDLMEEEHGEEDPSPVRKRIKPAAVSTNGTITADQIKKYVSVPGQNARVKDLAQVFGVSVEQVNAIISNPTNGLNQRKKGWVKVGP